MFKKSTLNLMLATVVVTMLLACNKPDASSAAPAGEPAGAEEATIRRHLSERLPNFPAVAEVRKTPIPGLFEVRVAESDIFYSDANGDYLIHGALLDTKTRKDLTKLRTDALTKVDFMKLPLQDAITFKRGNGERKLAVFADPNCPYCHKFEADLAKVDNVTVYTFVMPILGQDSALKSRAIWCAPDRAKAWADWMLHRVAPADAPCDTAALERNVEFGHAHKITGTPTLVFFDGSRLASAVPTAEIEKLLAERQ